MNHRTYRDMRPHFRNFFPHRYNLRERYPAALFESRALRELAGVDEMPDPAAWTADRRPGLMRRCALGIGRLDQWSDRQR